MRAWTNTCIQGNPAYRVEFMTDDSSNAWVNKTFSATRPDLVDAYLALSVPIFKADILRYLLLWAEGGIWLDLDVSCNGIPMGAWIPAEYKAKANLVVGWEFDHGHEGSYFHQLASWTIMSVARSPHMLQVIDDIFHDLKRVTAEQQIPVQNLTVAHVDDVVDFTGPRRLTRGIFASLAKSMNTRIEPLEVQEILQPRLIGDVLVLPGRSFAASVNRYRPEEEQELPPSLATHHYAGSWKNDRGGEAR